MSTTFDRSKFKGAKISSLKHTIEDAQKKSGWQGGRPGFHDIKEGSNIIRIAPPHDPNDPPLQPFRSAWLSCMLPEIDDSGNPTGKTTEQRKRIFISTIHCVGSPKDPIETYIDYVTKKVYDECDDKDERAKLLVPITGNFKPGKSNIQGIKPNTVYVAYCWKDGELGRIELNNQIVKRMEELNISEDPDQPIEVDIFSDPDTGVSMIITYDKDAKKGEKYIVKKREYDFSKYLNKYADKNKAIEAWENDRKQEVVSDEQLEEWSGKESLKDLYVGVYTTRDFELALNGLQLFDEKEKFGIFENIEFLKELEEIKSQIPVYEKSEKQKIQDGDDITENFNKTNVKKEDEESKVENDEPTEENSLDFKDWTPLMLKKYLRGYVDQNYGKDTEIPILSKEELIKWCELAEKIEELPFDSVNTNSDDKKVEEKQESSISDDLKAKIATLKGNIQNG